MKEVKEFESTLDLAMELFSEWNKNEHGLRLISLRSRLSYICDQFFGKIDTLVLLRLLFAKLIE